MVLNKIYQALPLFQDCSLFYTRRLCLKCAGKNIKEFPLELQQVRCVSVYFVESHSATIWIGYTTHFMQSLKQWSTKKLVVYPFIGWGNQSQLFFFNSLPPWSLICSVVCHCFLKLLMLMPFYESPQSNLLPNHLAVDWA